MINSIKNDDKPLPRVTQVSIAETSSTEQPSLKDKSMWPDQEKKYGEQERKAAVLYEYVTFKATEGELLLDTYIRYLQVINDLKKCGYSKDNYCKKVKVKDYEYYKTKMLLAKKDKDEQVLLAEDQAWMESSSDSDQEINANMVFKAQIEKVLSDSEVSSSSANEKIYEKRVKKANQQSKDFNNQNKDLQDKYDVLKNRTTFEMENEQLKELIEKNNDLLAQTKVLKEQLQVKHVVIDTHAKCQEKYAKLKAERYEYMLRYSTYFDNDKHHRKQIDDQEVLYDKMSVQLVEMDKHVRDLKNTVLEKDFKISELEECGVTRI
nr:hypothetical protein [Tanacetum cinerariifolium]